MEDKGDLLIKKKHIDNELSKSKPQIPLKYIKRESPITIISDVEEEVDSNEVIPFKMSFFKCLSFKF